MIETNLQEAIRIHSYEGVIESKYQPLVVESIYIQGLTPINNLTVMPADLQIKSNTIKGILGLNTIKFYSTLLDFKRDRFVIY